MVNFPSTTVGRKFRVEKLENLWRDARSSLSPSHCIYPLSAEVDQEVAIKIFLTRGGTKSFRAKETVESLRSLIDRRLKDSKISWGGGRGGA